MTASPALDQVAAHVREWRVTNQTIADLGLAAADAADNIANQLPDADPRLIGAVLLLANQIATQIMTEIGPEHPRGGIVVANTLGLAGEHLYTGGAA